MSAPTPAIMSKFAKAPLREAFTSSGIIDRSPEDAALLWDTAVLADLSPSDPGKIVRPGMREQVLEGVSDGVVKAKNLRPGQTVRAFLHGGPRGGERVVKTVTRIQGGAMVRVEFSSPHPTTDYKAAYRFHDESLVGQTVRYTNLVPGFVAYDEA